MLRFSNRFISFHDTDFDVDGFFDAGMLLQALKSRTKFDSAETKASERATVNARRRDVGKKLRLIDY